MSHASPSTINLTDQQREALTTTGVSVALSAGAGCGKTFVLTRRFLRQLAEFGVDRLAELVAITFTDRAAREMRDRIRRECKRRLQQSPAAERAGWLSLLREIDSARISTIHSFCAALLRTHAVEAGLDPQFEVLEADESKTLLQRSVTDSVRRLLIARKDEMAELVRECGLENIVAYLVELCEDRSFRPVDATKKVTPQQRADRWRELWETKFVPQLLQELADSAVMKEVQELLQQHCPAHPVMQRRREILLHEVPQLGTAAQPAEALERIRAAARVQGGGGNSVWEDETLYQQIRDLFQNVRKKCSRLLDQLQIPDEHLDQAARMSVLAERVLENVLADYETLKRRSGVVDFTDLLLHTRQLLQDNEEVRREAARGIAFLMVDEFQDTDPVQADIVRLLCGEELLSGKLFLVGDVKQSIYRFRKADPRVFTALRSEIPEKGRLPLSCNFRSQPQILHFVNALFHDMLGPDYEPLVAHARQLSAPPSVEFLFARPAEDEEEELVEKKENEKGELDGKTVAGTVSGKKRETVETRRQREADWIAARVAQLLNDSTPRIRVHDKETDKTTLRPVQPGDIAILFRTLNDVALYENALAQSGVRSYLVGGRAFFAQQEVYDLVNLLSFLDEPADEIALLGVLRSPMFGLTDETLTAAVLSAGSLRNALQQPKKVKLPAGQKEQFRHAAAVLTDLQRRKDSLPLAELLEEFLDRTGYDATLLSEFLGPRKLANLEKLIDMARGFDRSGLMTRAEFVQRLKESVREESREELAATHPEYSDVVKLMTVHQSKGLEFPVVIVADINRSPGGSRQDVRLHPELGPLLPLRPRQGESRKNPGQIMYRLEEKEEDLLEERRLFYVATTRAADHLILSGHLPENNKDRSEWWSLVTNKFDPHTGLPQQDPYLGRLALGDDISPEDIPQIRVHHEKPGPIAVPEEREKKIPLSQAEEILDNATPAPWPACAVSFPPHVVRQLEITPSELLQADQAVRNNSPHSSSLLHSAPLSEAGTEGADEVPSAGSQKRGSHKKARQKRAADLGTVIHEVLEHLETGTPAELDHLLAAANNRLDRPLSQRLRKTALQRLQRFVQSPLFEEMKAATKHYRELEFVLQKTVRVPGGKNHGSAKTAEKAEQAGVCTVLIAGKIDALLQREDGSWLLYDFKTGLPAGETVEDLTDIYAVQLAVYAEAVQQMVGGKLAEVGLIHVHDAVQKLLIPWPEAAEELTARTETALHYLISRWNVFQPTVGRRLG